MFTNKISKLFFLFTLLSVSLFAYPQISQDVKDKKIYPMGEKIYNAKCKGADLTQFKTYDTLFSSLQKDKPCGDLNRKHTVALSLYLWDVKFKNAKTYKKLTVSKDAKCQVCGMFLHGHPNWVSRINYPKGETYNFDGMKCMFKFYFNNKEGIKDILVQDYYTLQTINARKAYFVVGSDVYGPMGYELVPFKDKKSATIFLLEHNGKKIYSFDEVTEHMVRNLDR